MSPFILSTGQKLQLASCHAVAPRATSTGINEKCRSRGARNTRALVREACGSVMDWTIRDGFGATFMCFVCRAARPRPVTGEMREQGPNVTALVCERQSQQLAFRAGGRSAPSPTLQGDIDRAYSAESFRIEAQHGIAVAQAERAGSSHVDDQGVERRPDNHGFITASGRRWNERCRNRAGGRNRAASAGNCSPQCCHPDA